MAVMHVDCSHHLHQVPVELLEQSQRDALLVTLLIILLQETLNFLVDQLFNWLVKTALRRLNLAIVSFDVHVQETEEQVVLVLDWPLPIQRVAWI